eukprot:15444807-Alexandrium_andersonii.AAC.1
MSKTSSKEVGFSSKGTSSMVRAARFWCVGMRREVLGRQRGCSLSLSVEKRERERESQTQTTAPTTVQPQLLENRGWSHQGEPVLSSCPRKVRHNQEVVIPTPRNMFVYLLESLPPAIGCSKNKKF